jgi:hypothetical protein
LEPPRNSTTGLMGKYHLLLIWDTLVGIKGVLRKTPLTTSQGSLYLEGTAVRGLSPLVLSIEIFDLA